MPKTVLVLGGSLGGLGVTHRLLKYTLPHEPELKVVLVSKNSHFYWNIASVRAVIPGALKDSDLIQPIAPGLAQYPASSVEFVVGAATALDRDSKTVQVSVGDGSRAVSYDYLVIATGTSAADAGMPWKASSSYEVLLENLHDTAARIKDAESIVIAGGGPTGVETAAEIRYEFPDKEVILLCAGDALVGGDSIAASVESEARKLGVDVRKGVRSEDATRLEDGRTKVALSNGESIVTDFYLPTTGLVPNSGFLPTDILTEAKFVQTDEYLRVRNVPNAWAVGDIISKTKPSFLGTEAESASVAKNIDLVLRGEDEQPAKGPLLDVFLCSMGRKRGVGRLGFLQVPSFATWIVKSRTLGTERTVKYVNGTMW